MSLTAGSLMAVDHVILVAKLNVIDAEITQLMLLAEEKISSTLDTNI
jgi:hypothetical protein